MNFKPSSYYNIFENEDGTVDVYLLLDAKFYQTCIGIVERDAAIGVVKGVRPWDGMEDDIRKRFYAWCEASVKIDI